ncbi:MAG: diguanylate cyclase [Candidatus Omnitrophota bacterium]|nr:MAG: diguanylate cyclase [Candidatus Omnitrophota bacterium]
MRKVIYCIDKGLKKRLSLPFAVKKVSSVKNLAKEHFSIVVFNEDFIGKRKKVKFPQVFDKVYLMHFQQEDKVNLKVANERDFFDYFTDQDIKDRILFKLKKAQEYLDNKERVHNLERELVNKDKKIGKIVLLDPAADCYNWRYFLHRAQQEISRARRSLHPVSFLAVDIDYFRQINEVYSAKIGDEIIREFVGFLKSFLRKEDVLARWREDEFFILLPYMPAEEAHKLAKRIKRKIFSSTFKYKKLRLHIRTSIGVVSFPEDSVRNTRDIINALYKCLVFAKKKGGDSVVRYSKPPSDERLPEKKEENIEDLKTKIKKLNGLLTRDLLEMIYGFARAIEAKDFYTAKHVEYTATIAAAIAKKLHLPETEVEDIRRAGILHDLGKVGIDEKILSKKGPLTPEEWEIIKTHPWVAAEILREIHSLKGAIPSILYHHERWDGKGYPLGLKAEEIPLGARIVAVSDVYQALISDRPYRKAYSKRKAIEIIKEESGYHFDPKIVDIFLQVIKKIK